MVVHTRPRPCRYISGMTREATSMLGPSPESFLESFCPIPATRPVPWLRWDGVKSARRWGGGSCEQAFTIPMLVLSKCMQFQARYHATVSYVSRPPKRLLAKAFVGRGPPHNSVEVGPGPPPPSPRSHPSQVCCPRCVDHLTSVLIYIDSQCNLHILYIHSQLIMQYKY